MSKHTKGPWTLTEDARTLSLQIEEYQYQYDNDDLFDTKLQIAAANAALITAAPELLDALEHCIAYFKKYKPESCGIDDDRDCSPYNDAIQAIAKAEGKE